MLVKNYCAAILEINGQITCVEINVSSGLLNFKKGGLPDTSVKESKGDVTSNLFLI